jgi:hypothetical protein
MRYFPLMPEYDLISRKTIRESSGSGSAMGTQSGCEPKNIVIEVILAGSNGGDKVAVDYMLFYRLIL